MKKKMERRRVWLSPWGLGFFTLPNNYSAQIHNQIFEMCYYGNGYTFKDVYDMPVHIRNFHYKKLADAKKKEKEESDKAMKKVSPSVGKPNIRVRK